MGFSGLHSNSQEMRIQSVTWIEKYTYENTATFPRANELMRNYCTLWRLCTPVTTSMYKTSNGSWCMGIKGEMSGTVCVTFTWDMYIYIYIWVVYSFCLFCCLFIVVTWWYVWCIEWASGNQEEVQACLVTLCLFIISCYSLYKTTLGLFCSWFENNPYFHKYSMDFHVKCVYLD